MKVVGHRSRRLVVAIGEPEHGPAAARSDRWIRRDRRDRGELLASVHCQRRQHDVAVVVTDDSQDVRVFDKGTCCHRPLHRRALVVTDIGDHCGAKNAAGGIRVVDRQLDCLLHLSAKHSGRSRQRSTDADPYGAAFED
jgi:hypothetical protein